MTNNEPLTIEKGQIWRRKRDGCRVQVAIVLDRQVYLKPLAVGGRSSWISPAGLFQSYRFEPTKRTVKIEICLTHGNEMIPDIGGKLFCTACSAED